MDTQATSPASLAVLLHAERLGRPLSLEALAQRFALSGRFRPRRAEAYAALSRAAGIAAGATTMARLLRDAGAADEAAVTQLAGKLGVTTSAGTGPVLLVCESRPFEPDPGHLHDQVLLRLLARLASLGMTGWILRSPRARVRPLKWLLAGLPQRPAGIVSVGVSHPQCLEALASLAPVVRLGTRSIASRQIPCVEHDARLEAAAITAYAAAQKAEQIAFVARIGRPAGRRRVEAEDMAVLSALTVEAQNRHIAVPGNLTFWVDTDQTLQAAGILPKILKHAQSRILLVIAGPVGAAEVASAPARPDSARIVCRYWSTAGAPSVPVIGPDPNQLAEVVLARLLGQTGLPAEAAVLVPPAWHREP